MEICNMALYLSVRIRVEFSFSVMKWRLETITIVESLFVNWNMEINFANEKFCLTMDLASVFSSYMLATQLGFEGVGVHSFVIYFLQ